MLFTAGAAVILTNKHKQNNPHPHFHSVHAYLGVTTVALLTGQYTIGVLMWAVPAAFGGEERAKKVWKYHRMGGYVILAMLLATVIAATKTPYNKGVLDIKTWSVAIAAALIVVGVYPRVSVTKFGFKAASERGGEQAVVV